jgi:HemK-related putative methylase
MKEENNIINNFDSYEVYEPAEDSLLIEKHIQNYAKGEILEIGCGSGILCEEAIKYCDSYIGLDINPKAIKYCKKNIKNPKASFILSNLFENFNNNNKFDLIICNPPYLPEDKGIKDPALYGGKKGFEIIQRIFLDISNYLKEEGIILLLFSQLTKKEIVDEIILKSGFDFECIDKKIIFFEELYVYKIKKSKLIKELEKKSIKNIKYLSKGKRGVIYTGFIDNKIVSVKTKKDDSKAIERINNESYWLKELNKYDIGPRYLFNTKDYVVYEYAKGVHLKEILEIIYDDLNPKIKDNNKDTKIRILFDKYKGSINKKSKEKILFYINNKKEIFLELLRQAFILDELNVNKFELTRPFKNVIVGDKIILIDFERSKKTINPKNVTQICQFILNFEPILKIELMNLCEEYKTTTKTESKNLLYSRIKNLISNKL